MGGVLGGSRVEGGVRVCWDGLEKESEEED